MRLLQIGFLSRMHTNRGVEPIFIVENNNKLTPKSSRNYTRFGVFLSTFSFLLTYLLVGRRVINGFLTIIVIR